MEDVLARFKVKHLVWIPIIGFIQIYFLWHYANKADHIRKAKDAFVSKHFEDAETWRSEFLVHFDYAIAGYEGESGVDAKDVTLVSQCSPDNLHHIESLIKRWKGPMSIAVFSPDRDAVSSMFGIQILRKCNADIRRFVTFHIMYPSSHPPRFDETVLDFTENDCSTALSHLRESEGQNYARGELPYPQNSLRNIARVKIKTDLFYLVDIDTVPSLDLRYLFTKFAKKRGLFNQTKLEAFITPAFEIRSHHALPKNKDEAIRLVDDGEMRPFHYDTCPNCQKPTEFDHWYGYRGSEDLEDAFEIEYANAFEPFYLANKDAAPLHDERFKAYGFDRISQICEMYVKGFTFYALNNAFIIHKGFKFKKDFHDTRDYENKKNSKIYEKYFKPELKMRYPDSGRECLDEVGNRRGHVQVNVDNLKQILKRGVDEHMKVVDRQTRQRREDDEEMTKESQKESTEEITMESSEEAPQETSFDAPRDKPLDDPITEDLSIISVKATIEPITDENIEIVEDSLEESPKEELLAKKIDGQEEIVHNIEAEADNDPQETLESTIITEDETASNLPPTETSTAHIAKDTEIKALVEIRNVRLVGRDEEITEN